MRHASENIGIQGIAHDSTRLRRLRNAKVGIAVCYFPSEAASRNAAGGFVRDNGYTVDRAVFDNAVLIIDSHYAAGSL